MNSAFKSFLDLPEPDRKDVFEAAAERLDTLATYIEKDFWVCLTLDILFNSLPQGHPNLLFKGGTSLSKAYGLIKRFSEDIDITVFRTDLGFADDKDPAAPGLTGNQRRRLLQDLKKTAAGYIMGKLHNDFSTVVNTVINSCTVEPDPADTDKCTLLFQYPSLFPQDSSAYIQPKVKIASGARSALGPNCERSIVPYIAQEMKRLNFSVYNIITTVAERTFCDKIMILHGWHCGHRDAGRLPDDRDRLSRHYYDVANIVNTDVGERAIADLKLMEDVRIHTMNFFSRGWTKLEEAILGSFRLVPQRNLRKALANDYRGVEGLRGDEERGTHLENAAPSLRAGQRRHAHRGGLRGQQGLDACVRCKDYRRRHFGGNAATSTASA